MFSSCTNLTDVTIGNSVTSIGSDWFQSCTKLTSVMIGNAVTNIATFAFWSLPNLTGVYFHGNAPSGGSSPFAFDNKSLTVYYLLGTTGWGATFKSLPTALWKPLMQTSDGGFGVQTNKFGFNISWASGQVVVVEACTNLSNPVWSPLQTNTLTGGSSYFSDPKWTNYPGRFYRLRSP